MKQFFKMCNVFRRAEGFFLFGVLNTPYGGIGIPPASKLALTANASEVGATLGRILDGLPDKITEVDLASSAKIYDEYIKEIGFSKSSVFEKKASLVGVHFDGLSYAVVPHQKDERGAFVALAPTKLPHPFSSEGLGKAILAAFESTR